MRIALTYALLAFSSPAFSLPSEEAFPPAAMLGAAEDPLESLAAESEELRDAPASPRGADWLQAGLRSPMPERRLAAVRAAGVPGRIVGVPHLNARLLRLDEQPDIRAAAAVALGRIGDPMAAGPLAEALRDPAPEVRYASALALGRVPADGSATRLTRALKEDPSWWVRWAAAAALGRLKRPFAASALEESLKLEPRWQVRLQAVRALQELGGKRAAGIVVFALLDRDAGVRAAAGLALAEIGAEAELPPLRDALRAENDPSTRSVLVAAFRRILAKP